MLNFLFWICIGLLSGWIGYLAARTEENDPINLFLLVGVIGGVLGGISAGYLGLADTSGGIIDTGSAFNALIMSTLLVTLLAIWLNFFRNASSGRPRAGTYDQRVVQNRAIKD